MTRDSTPALDRPVYDADHEAFRASVAKFIHSVVAPNFERWEGRKRPDRELFSAAGDHGLLLFGTPEEYGGAGIADFRFNAVLDEEFARAGYASAGLSLALQNDVLAPYLTELTDHTQRRRWLPGLTNGSLIGAIAMTEPGAGSDLSGMRTRAVRDGNDYIINGTKTFISSGQNCDLVVVATRTGDDKHRGMSLIVVETDTPGFTKGRNLDKLGLRGQDTSELNFVDVRVPSTNRLGDEGSGFYYLMRNLPQERLSLAISAVAAAEGVLAQTLEYVRGRNAFGRPIGTFQHNRFLLAELTTELDIARVFVDHCVALHAEGRLTATRAAKAKWWTTELQVRVADRCLQLHGGYGYMREYPVSRAFVDARVQTIYGGTTEIMKEIIGKDLGL